MGNTEINIKELTYMMEALSNRESLIYYGPSIGGLHDKLLERKKELDEGWKHAWSKTNLHMVNQLWPSTACGWGGIGGAAMTYAFTTVVECIDFSMSFVYWHGKLAYVVEMDQKYFDFVSSKHHAMPSLANVENLLTVLYKKGK